ncbi:MAG: hypothetical protein HYY37_03550 [Candidatus Aenigmarchaeota archaeon]|nr:hypothetical protein [Candidatus Aenigmarchaeota archaeon]
MTLSFFGLVIAVHIVLSPGLAFMGYWYTVWVSLLYWWKLPFESKNKEQI